jgi:hypothetical protein
MENDVKGCNAKDMSVGGHVVGSTRVDMPLMLLWLLEVHHLKIDG